MPNVNANAKRQFVLVDCLFTSIFTYIFETSWFRKTPMQNAKLQRQRQTLTQKMPTDGWGAMTLFSATKNETRPL